MRMRKTYNPVKQMWNLNKQQLDSVKFFGPSPRADYSQHSRNSSGTSSQTYAKRKWPYRFINDWEMDENDL